MNLLDDGIDRYLGIKQLRRSMRYKRNEQLKGACDGIRFLLVSGEPLKEPVAWYGPIVMNTQEQLQQAFEELREGTFLNPRK